MFSVNQKIYVVKNYTGNERILPGDIGVIVQVYPSQDPSVPNRYDVLFDSDRLNKLGTFHVSEHELRAL